MRIIVTGSEGFLGSHLVKRLSENGNQVIGWDIKNGNDVCKENGNPENIDAIFHFACPVNPGNYEEVALSTALSSSIGTYNMLDLAKENGAKFMYVSSSEVYGFMKADSFKEENIGIVDPIAPRSYYSESKRFGEMITMIYHRHLKLDVRIIRPFNIYGPGMREDDTRVIPSFMRAKRDNKQLVLNDGGKTVRTFCYIDDFIDFVIISMFGDDTNGQVYNVGTEEKINMFDLAHLISNNVELTNNKRRGEQLYRKPNIDKAIKLGWEPKISLKKGLELMWKSYQ